MSLVDRLAKMYSEEFMTNYNAVRSKIEKELNETHKSQKDLFKRDMEKYFGDFLKEIYPEDIFKNLEYEVDIDWCNRVTIRVNVSKAIDNLERVKKLEELLKKLDAVKEQFEKALNGWRKAGYERRLAKMDVEPFEFDYSVLERILDEVKTL